MYGLLYELNTIIEYERTIQIRINVDNLLRLFLLFDFIETN